MPESPTILASFDAAIAKNPSKTAIYWGRDRISYRGLDACIRRCATALQSRHGIRPHDRVGILLRNSPEFIYALYAVLRTGATAVPVNTFLKTPEIQHVLDDCRLTCLITDESFAEVTGALERVALVPIQSLSGDTVTSSRQFPAVSLSDVAVIIYTSGTTGKPKGAMLTHGNIAANVQSCIAALEENDDDRMALLLPMFHSFMLTVCIFMPLALGASIVLIRSVHPFRAAMREMIRNRATVFCGIPQIFQALAQAKIPFWMHWVLRLRMAISGAAPLPRQTHEAFESKMRFPLLEGYGLSEASPVVSFNPIHGKRKPGSVGLPLPGVEVQIFDDHDREVPCGEVGEIVVRGANVMVGYHNHPGETAEALRNGWLHTGDMGRKDSDGYIYIVDRRKEMLLVRGLNVYPREIEEIIYKVPGIREVAVVARLDEKRGEIPVAFVSPVEGAALRPSDVLRYCREQLADYKIPREIRILEALPHTATGKIAKLELKKLLS